MARYFNPSSLLSVVYEPASQTDGMAEGSIYGHARAELYRADGRRFVTSVADSDPRTDGPRRNMFHAAKEAGLPAAFVELRHEITHGAIPSLVVLRTATERALDWLWERWWARIGGDLAAVDGNASGLVEGEKVRQDVKEEKEAVRVDDQWKMWLEMERADRERERERERDKAGRRRRRRSGNDNNGRSLGDDNDDDDDEEEDEYEDDCGGWVKPAGIWIPRPIGVV
ncbi:MAG: hypothetical protein M1825_006510 [Sarcosagium campestre]|nr:MAG: hypothetical protein M1825_006510 [Sarcosagium campestre]